MLPALKFMCMANIYNLYVAEIHQQNTVVVRKNKQINKVHTQYHLKECYDCLWQTASWKHRLLSAKFEAQGVVVGNRT